MLCLRGAVVRSRHRSTLLRIFGIVAAVVFLLSVAFIPSCYQIQNSTAPGELTSLFLDTNTDAYVSFNLKPGLTSSTRFAHVYGLFDDALVQEIQNRFGSGIASLLLGITDVNALIGPEVAAATIYTPTSAGVVLFIQTPLSTPQSLLDLLLLALNYSLGTGVVSYPAVGITQVSRTVGGIPQTEYYAIAAGYVLGAFGHVALADFQAIKGNVPGGVSNSLWSNSSFQQTRSKPPSQRMGLAYVSGARL